MGLDRLQDLHHVFAAKLRHEGRGPGRISLDQPRDNALTPLTSSRISAGNAAASGSVSGVSRNGKRSVMERDGRGWTPGIIRHPHLIIPRLLPIIAGLALAGPFAQGDELRADIAVHLAVDDDAVLHPHHHAHIPWCDCRNTRYCSAGIPAWPRWSPWPESCPPPAAMSRWTPIRYTARSGNRTRPVPSCCPPRAWSTARPAR